MAATLRDIADRAGVSSAAVSMALNNKKGVGRDKAREIRRIAGELGYLKLPEVDVAGRTVHFIQVLKPSQTWDDSYKVFIAEYIQGLTIAAATSGIIVEVKTFRTEDLESVRANLREADILGTMFLGAGLFPRDIRILKEATASQVFIDVCYPGIGVDCIDMDNAQCVYEVVEHLIARGHTSIGLVQAEEWTPNFAMREEAFRAALDELGLADSDRSEAFRIQRDQNRGKEQMVEQLRSRTSLPTALFCVNDMIAYNCIHACEELGIAVPGDIAVVGFDDLPASKIMHPRLTTVSVPRERISKRALEVLLDRVNTSAYKAPERILIGGRLVVRESA
ncbi:MAG: LacI family transcriptional regulator [Spirochaetales bacterium]|nr:LacI family transcriptional regulator [Spirochaetales bacterium]